MKNLPRLYRTLKDIPPKQLIHRLGYEAKIRTISKLRPETRAKLLLGKLTTPPLRESYLDKLFVSKNQTEKFEGKLSFEFLNEKLEFEKIIWNSREYPRLWQFHLHYFDYLSDDLSKVYNHDLEENAFLAKANHLINDWIDNNPFYSFDGWHPYTTSLRLVNWMYAFKAFPNLASEKVLDSTWKQLVYLTKNKEGFAGGNHLLENLRAIIIAGLYFENAESENIVKKAIVQLESELNKQILADGGHFELSSSYHLLMAKLLSEVIIAIKSAGRGVPEVCLRKLGDMLEYSQTIRLKNGTYPLWNDASFDSAPAIDQVIHLASSVLDLNIPEHSDNAQDPLFARLLQEPGNEANASSESKKLSGLSKLEASGYYFLRKNDIEISFDAAMPGPKELPGHAHADCLSFNLYKNGEPLIVETGTSQYGSGKARTYERSTAAHNTVVINGLNQSEIWGGFRVGTKAKPIDVKSGQSEDTVWASASHDGYDKLDAKHSRWIGLSSETTIIIDMISGNDSLNFDSYVHFAPGQEVTSGNNKVILEPSGLIVDIFSNNKNLSFNLNPAKTSESYYSPEMGLKIPRAKLKISGTGSKSSNTIIVCMVFHFGDEVVKFSSEKRHLSLQFSDKSLKWIINDREILLLKE